MATAPSRSPVANPLHGVAAIPDGRSVRTPDQWCEPDVIERLITLYEPVTERPVAPTEALVDAATGLPGRLLFQDRLGQALELADRYGHIVALLLLELDNEPTLVGSADAGRDNISISAVARRLRTRMRRSDTVARIGSDTLAIILPDIRCGHNATAVARKLLALLAEGLAADGPRRAVSTAIGISLYPIDGGDCDAIVAAAMAAAGHARRLGAPGYQFYKHLHVV